MSALINNINNKRFRHLDVVTDNAYEIELNKQVVKYSLPFHIGSSPTSTQSSACYSSITTLSTGTAYQTSEETQVVSIYSTVVVFLKPNDCFVTFHIGGQADADANYGVLKDAVDEKGHICLKYTDPVRVRSQCNCPLTR